MLKMAFFIYILERQCSADADFSIPFAYLPMAYSDTELTKYLTTPYLHLNETFIIGSRPIAVGTFGEVRVAKHKNTPETFAAKCERVAAKNPLLEHESFVYRILGAFDNDGTSAYPIGIPKVFDFGTVDKPMTYNAIVMEMLGISLHDSFKRNSNTFALRSVVYISQQLLQRIEYVHSKGIIHRDIKPSNFLFGRKDTGAENVMHIIDFGLSAIDLSTDGPVGTRCFWSVNSHNGIKQGKRDDVESILYVIIFLFKGELDWGALPTFSPRMIELKRQNPKMICAGLPIQLESSLCHVRQLKENQTPNYTFLKQMMQEIWDGEKFDFNEPFEWNVSDCDQNSE